MKYTLTPKFENDRVYPCVIYVTDENGNPLFHEIGKTFEKAREDVEIRLQLIKSYSGIEVPPVETIEL